MKRFKAGISVNQGYYSSFQPSILCRQWLLEDMEIQYLLSQADRQLGRLDMYSEYLPNLDLYISMHLAKEATQSTKIEGTQTNMQEIFLEKEDLNEERRDDWVEVHNYIKAMDSAIEKLETLPFSSRLIRDTHRILLEGTRGEQKSPGTFRSIQNWIGGTSLKDAVFIPPVHTSIQELMTDLEEFAHEQTYFFPDLLKIALIHYQFETIHPFLDGNGRIGRLMIPLYLVEKGILNKPILYLSDFFERNRSLYYDNLMRVRTHDDIQHWFKFFLVGIIETAKSGVSTFDAVLKLKAEKEELILKKSSRSIHLFAVLEHLYQRPIINAQDVAKYTGVSLPTAYRIIEELVAYGVLKEMTGGNRGQIFMYEAYIKLF